MTDRKLKILFFCTGNSCRSQMAEGWAKKLKSDAIEAYSAGIRGSYLDPVVMNMMKAAGVDITSQRSKGLDEVAGIAFDYVISLCPNRGECDKLAGNPKVVTVAFDDPPQLATEAETEEEALLHYVRIRDEIRDFVETLPGSLENAVKEQ